MAVGEGITIGVPARTVYRIYPQADRIDLPGYGSFLHIAGRVFIRINDLGRPEEESTVSEIMITNLDL